MATNGYACLALSYFSAPGLPEDLINIDLEYFETALNWLSERSDTTDARPAVVGRSRGGELSLLLGMHFGVETVIAWVPSGIVHAGIRQGTEGWLCVEPAWLFKGEPIPFLPHNEQELHWSDGVVFCTPTYLESLGNWDRVSEASMPLEHCESRVLLISGALDDVWPSSLFSELAMSRLRSRVDSPGEWHLALAGAGHRTLPSTLPSPPPISVHPQAGERLALGGTSKGNSAGREAYAAMLTVLAGGSLD